MRIEAAEMCLEYRDLRIKRFSFEYDDRCMPRRSSGILR
jgi:hypothetical protein